MNNFNNLIKTSRYKCSFNRNSLPCVTDLTFSALTMEECVIAAVMGFYKGRPPRYLCIERDWDKE